MTILGHIQACPTRFLAQKTFVILKKRWPNKNLYLGRPACIPKLQYLQILDIEPVYQEAYNNLKYYAQYPRFAVNGDAELLPL